MLPSGALISAGGGPGLEGVGGGAVMGMSPPSATSIVQYTANPDHAGPFFVPTALGHANSPTSHSPESPRYEQN